ncbi:TetR/AcrR family transcriptional regulator [Acinetobacter pittii]|nr:TetR/AcrR family transcriptional regulator [Acinetobacter pittii]PPC07593.1 TetR family transcriptional regulator [Acinetobacter pittii]WPP60918.1 TetR/AcrR family transcriptional regulator [Acinetobacter pittii]
MSNMEIPFSSSMILHTSRYLFDQHGFHNVGVDRISKESNVSKMTFYKHFKSKEKLIELCLEFHQETLQQQVSSILSTNLKSQNLDKLKEIYFLHADLKSHYHLIFKAIFEIEKMYPQAYRVVIKYREWLINTILEILLNIKSSSSIEEARLLIYIIDSSIIQSLVNDEIDHREYIWSYFADKIYHI